MTFCPQLLTACAILAAGPVFAQTSAAKPPANTVPEKIAPGAKPTAPAKTLSRELNTSGGVIHPQDVDPQMNKGAPKTGDRNVTPPPGTPGGAPAPQPK